MNVSAPNSFIGEIWCSRDQMPLDSHEASVPEGIEEQFMGISCQRTVEKALNAAELIRLLLLRPTARKSRNPPNQKIVSTVSIPISTGGRVANELEYTKSIVTLSIEVRNVMVSML